MFRQLATVLVATLGSGVGCSDAASGPDFEEFESTPDGPMCLELEDGCVCALEEISERKSRDVDECAAAYECCGLGQLSDDGLMGCACIDVPSSECERNISKFPSPLERVDACTSQLVWDEF
jgi:hypothetical protein